MWIPTWALVVVGVSIVAICATLGRHGRHLWLVERRLKMVAEYLDYVAANVSTKGYDEDRNGHIAETAVRTGFLPSQLAEPTGRP